MINVTVPYGLQMMNVFFNILFYHYIIFKIISVTRVQHMQHLLLLTSLICCGRYFKYSIKTETICRISTTNNIN